MYVHFFPAHSFNIKHGRGLMNSSDESKRKLVEFLWVEINRAILTSKEVKSSIKILRDLDLLDHLSDYNLVLDVNALVDLIQRNETIRESKDRRAGDKPEVQDKAAVDRDEIKPLDMVDGKELSRNEVQFQKHMEKNFDEGEWMKQIGIRFLNSD